MEVCRVSVESQLTLPKEFAGKLVSIEKLSEGVLQIKAGKFIPDSEMAFHTEAYQRRLAKFDRWMDTHVPLESNLDEMHKE